MFTGEQLKGEYIEIRKLYYKQKEEVASLRQDLTNAEREAARLYDWMADIEKRYDSEYGCGAGKTNYCLSTIVKREETSSE